jgi:tetratricopeptide (TPR) repeat protein
VSVASRIIEYRASPLSASRPEKLPPALKAYHAIDLRDVDSAHAQFSRLAASLTLDAESGNRADEEEIGDRLRGSGDFSGALPYYNKAISLALSRFGESHPVISRLRRKIGAVFVALGNLASAEAEFRTALTVDEYTFGKEHSTVAADLNNLAQVRLLKGELGEAKSLLERAQQITEKSFGPEDPAVATDLNNLARLLGKTSRFEEAERLYRRALRIFAEFGHSTGHEHPSFRKTINNYERLLTVMMGLSKDEVEARVRSAIERSQDPDSGTA